MTTLPTAETRLDWRVKKNRERQLMPRQWLLLAVLIGATLSGCAFTDRNVKLQYPPPPESGAAQAATPAVAARQDVRPIVVGAFTDPRPNRQKIGFVQNTYGMTTADVLAASDVAQWVREALVFELNQSGYSAALGDATQAPPDRLVITGQIVDVEAKAYVTYNSQIVLATDVRRGNASLSRRNYVGQGGGGVNVAATEAGYARSVSLALQDALRKLIADLGTLPAR